MKNWHWKDYLDIIEYRRILLLINKKRGHITAKRILFNLGILGLSLFILTNLLVELNQTKAEFKESIQMNWPNIKIAADENVELIREISISGRFGLEQTEKIALNHQMILTNIGQMEGNRHLENTLNKNRSPLSIRSHAFVWEIDNNLLEGSEYKDNYDLIRSLEDFYLLLSSDANTLINISDYNKWVRELNEIFVAGT